MPLDSDEEGGGCRIGDGFDHAVGGRRFYLDAITEFVEGLFVDAVDGKSFCREELCENAAFFDTDVMHISGGIDMSVARVAAHMIDVILIVDPLMKGAAKGNIHSLHRATDAKERNAQFTGLPDKEQIGGVMVFVEYLRRCFDFGSVLRGGRQSE